MTAKYKAKDDYKKAVNGKIIYSKFLQKCVIVVAVGGLFDVGLGH